MRAIGLAPLGVALGLAAARGDSEAAERSEQPAIPAPKRRVQVYSYYDEFARPTAGYSRAVMLDGAERPSRSGFSGSEQGCGADGGKDGGSFGSRVASY